MGWEDLVILLKDNRAMDDLSEGNEQFPSLEISVCGGRLSAYVGMYVCDLPSSQYKVKSNVPSLEVSVWDGLTSV